MDTSDWNARPDEELVQIAAQKGPQAVEAESQLMERYKNFVRSKARPFFLMGADSEDVIQEGMIGLYKAVMDFDPSKNVSFHAFADLCITRQIQSAVKQAGRKKQMPLNNYVSLNRTITDEEDKEVSMMEILPADSSYNPERSYIEKENINRLTQKIQDGLSTMENQVLKFYLSGLNYQEIARHMGKPTKSIDNALQRIKKKIGGLLKELR